jgi:hypothetical protein
MTLVLVGRRRGDPPTNLIDVTTSIETSPREAEGRETRTRLNMEGIYAYISKPFHLSAVGRGGGFLFRNSNSMSTLYIVT